MPVFDANTPVHPAIDGVTVIDGIQMCAAGDPRQVEDFIKTRLAWKRTLAADIETVGTNELSFQIKVVTIGCDTAAVALDPRSPWQAHLILALFQQVDQLIFHNAAFDIPPLVHQGLLHIDDVGKVFDTLVLARMAEPDTLVKKDLTTCAKRYLNIELDTENGIKKAFKAAGHRTLSDGFANMDIDSPVYLHGAMKDTVVTYRLAEKVWQAAYDRIITSPFTDNRPDAAGAAHLIDREQRVNQVMLRRSALGIRVDLDYLDKHRDDHAQEVAAAEKVITDAGLKPGNGAALVKVLDERGVIPPGWKKTNGGALSSAADEMEKLAGNPLVDAHLSYKGLGRVSQYLEQVESYARTTGRLHPQVGVLGASATGRMAYGGGVPLQQFSAAARGILIADPGRQFTSIDWSSIEPILMANVAGEMAMVQAYEAGEDLYGPVMAASNASRKDSKVVLLAGMYGQGLALLAQNLKLWTSERVGEDEYIQVPDEMAAGLVRNKVMGAMPNIKMFLDKLKSIGNQYGQITTISGRILSIPKSMDGKGFAGYKAQNYFNQGSAYDILADTIYRLRGHGLAHHIVLAMHDELVLDCDQETAAYIRQIMQQPPSELCLWAGRVPKLRTDLEVLGERWSKPE